MYYHNTYIEGNVVMRYETLSRIRLHFNIHLAADFRDYIPELLLL